MYKVCLLLETPVLLAKLTALHVWGGDTGFEIEAVCTNIHSLQDLLNHKKFDLLIAESNMESDYYATLKKIKREKLCNHIALCSTNGDFETARKGILIGVDDYFALPFYEEMLFSLFERIKDDEDNDSICTKDSYEKFSKRLADLFLEQEKDIYNYLDYLSKHNVINDVIDGAVKIIFSKNDWLDLYINESEILASGVVEPQNLKVRFLTLYENYYCHLFPRHNDTLDEIVKYILYNPESDLRQKVLAEKLHINKSYMSTVFIAQTNVRFVDYVTGVKLMRAAWLLKNTELKVGEIAQRIDYKDVAYFSTQFKKNFNYTPSEYRLPDGCQFVI